MENTVKSARGGVIQKGDKTLVKPVGLNILSLKKHLKYIYLSLLLMYFLDMEPPLCWS